MRPLCDGSLRSFFDELAFRLRRVRVCCGGWERVLTPSVTEVNGLTAIFLDPPYNVDRGMVYSQDSFEISSEVREWAKANGSNKNLRIALCGYEGEHRMPADWEVVQWKANGGYGNQSEAGNTNCNKERIWFSPHCLRPRDSLFNGTE